ncbi:hypothetical protein NPIL_201991, partial [Nephila pilipes]
MKSPCRRGFGNDVTEEMNWNMEPRKDQVKPYLKTSLVLLR